MADASKVTTGKPKVGGAIFAAPFGTTLPTSTADVLDAAFKELGFVSEDGVTNTNGIESDSYKAWGGQTVIDMETEKTDTWAYTLIEALNVNVLKEIYGDANVTGDLDTGITVNANASELPYRSLVIDMIMKDAVKKRVVIPYGKITEIGDITYADDAPVGYPVTISAAPDTAGNTHYEYISK